MRKNEDTPPSKRRLENENGIVSFKTKFNLQSGKITITFSDTGETQEFFGYRDFLYELSYYYRRRLETIENVEEKIQLCEVFLNYLHMCLTDWRRFYKDKENLYNEVQLYIEQFKYFKLQYEERKNIFTVEVKEGETLSISEKLIALSYLGILDSIATIVPLQKNQASLLSLLLDRNFDNVKKTLREVNGKPKQKDAVKTRKTLANVLELGKATGIKLIESKAREDLGKIS